MLEVTNIIDNNNILIIMTETLIIVTISIAGTFIATKLSQIEDDLVNIFDTKYTFGEEATPIIDDFLINNGTIKSYMHNGRKLVPFIGNHYYGSWWNYIKLKKKRELIDNKYVYTYTCYVRFYNKRYYNNMVGHINQQENNIVRVISIDTSSHNPKLIYATKILEQPFPYQTSAVNHIINDWQAPKFNTKVLITGKRGSGKSYMGRLIKSQLDRTNNTQSKLYDDFNPSSIGVNIHELILNHASHSAPTIILINEIDISYAEAVEERTEYDPRLKYTRNKQTLNNMFDAISDTKYVIALYTTEKSYEELNQTEEYKSFIRKGRIDFVINLSNNECNKFDIQ